MDSLKKSSSNRQNSERDAMFNCEICETNFTLKHSLIKHVKIVHGEQKKVVCNVCFKTFGLET